MKTLTPFGVQDFLPEQAKTHKKRISKLHTLFEKEGYQPVRTPVVEYMNSIKIGMEKGLEDQSIKFFDNNSQMMTLRPDHTVPIARLVSSQMKTDKLPLKLSYSGPIFRSATQSQDMEQFQAGLEVIGSDSAKTDAGIISLCIDALLALGIKDLHIDIGHTDFLKKLTPKQKAALLKGDYVDLGYVPERGDIKSVSKHGYLKELDGSLKAVKSKVSLNYNKGLIKNIQYYTGLIFECYSPSSPQILASGGRYDGLLKKFGFDQPACGFAINLNALPEKRS